MKMKTKLSTLLAVCALTCVALAAETAAELFQKAVTQERAAGNLEEAIKLYQRVAREFASDRPLAAKALVQAARCYEKLGQDKSIKLYEQVTREFADQREPAATARERLTAIRAAAKPKTAPGMVARQLPVSTGRLKQSDGRHIFYVSAAGLVATEMDGTGERVIFSARGRLNGGVLTDFVVSRDGKRVAFGLVRDKESLWVIGSDGSGAREVYAMDQRRALRILDWSPDGRHILASMLQSDRTWALVGISEADGSTIQLASNQLPLSPAKFSPDGKFVAYSTPETNPPLSPADIYVVPVDGGQPAKLVERVSGDKFLDWTPDGSHILFLSNRNGTPSIFALAVSQGRATGDSVLVKQDTGYVTYASMARDGTLYYSLGGIRAELYLVSLDPLRRIVSAPRRITERGMGAQYSGAWSPDGRQLAYTAVTPDERGTPQASQYSLIIRTLDTGHERKFTLPGSASTGNISTKICWSPDGTAVYQYFPLGPEQQFGLRSISAANGEVTQVAAYPKRRWIYSLSRSHDGRALLIGFTDVEPPLESQPPRAFVLRRDLATGEETEIVSKSAATEIAISPDGALAAALDFRKGEASVSVRALDGGDWKKITAFPMSRAETLLWAPGSEAVFFSGHSGFDDAGATLYSLPAAGGEPRRLQLPQFPSVHIKAAHQDGKQILFQATSASSELWALENLTIKLKAAR